MDANGCRAHTAGGSARVELCFAEGSLDGLVVDAGHLHGNDGVGQTFRFADFGDTLSHGSQAARGMLDDGGFDDDFAIEVTEHPFGPSFSAIDRDDAEVFRPDGLHTLLDLAVGLPDKSFFRAREFLFS